MTETKAQPSAGGAKPSGSARRQYEPYTKAAWGLINHWYPALMTSELAEKEVKNVKICGIPILLRRVDGKVYAMRDQCVHRGVRMSIRPVCFTDDTITCWYHGYTYDMRTGELVTILGAPDDDVIGTTGVRVFEVREVNGLIFVFVCEPGYEPIPDLSEDLPPRMPDDYEHRVAHPLDPDTVILGHRRVANANWRLGVENGSDPGHNFLHRDAEIIIAEDIALPLGLYPTDPRALTIYEDEGGPKGVMNEWESGYYTLVMESERLGISGRGGRELKGLRTSAFLPAVVMIENWPRHGLAQYEWYVPIDDVSHVYINAIAKTCETPDERARFEHDFEHYYKPVGLERFNEDDLFARQAMQNFYSDGGPGWDDEELCSMDSNIVAFRKLVSRYARGFQTPQTHPRPRD